MGIETASFFRGFDHLLLEDEEEKEEEDELPFHNVNYRKIPKISLGAYIFQRPFSMGLFLEGLIFGGAYLRRQNLRFQIDWASLIVGSKFTVFALFYFVFEGNFPSTSSRGAYIWRGDLTEGFLRCRFGGRIFGGADTRRGVFSEFYGTLNTLNEF